MNMLPQGMNTTSYVSPSETVLTGVNGDVGKTLEPRHKDRMLANFFCGLDEYIVNPRFIDFIVRHNLAQDPAFQQSLKEKLVTILQSPAMLSDRGWNLQNFLIILATYREHVFTEVQLPAPTIEVLRSRVEFLRANGQSGSMVDTLEQFLPKH